MRAEQEVFDELAALCGQPGYLHAVAYFCFRDSLIRIPEGEKLVAKHLHNLYGEERLIRTEITTLIGLALKGALNLTLPPPDVLQEYMTKTESLLAELHLAMSAIAFADLTPEALKTGTFNPFESGAAMREPIFYGGESAYGFQYRDFAVLKYTTDDSWLKTHKGFSIGDAAKVVSGICDFQRDHLPAHMEQMRSQDPSRWTMLPGFECSLGEVAKLANLPADVVARVVDAFMVPAGETNAGFKALGDFNAAAAFPILKAGPKSFLVLQQYGVLEALYEAPFYWTTVDVAYRAQAWENRGKFAERFSEEALRRVFDSRHVFSNVDINESKDKRLSEIDVLVLFGDRAIVLQAKSKRLTLEARKGNDQQIKDDFRKSVQDAYDQGLLCAKALSESSRYEFKPQDGRALTIPNLREIYILCVVTDHYPALAFQARQFLKYEATERIAPPFVMDVFTLDAVTEMLQSPLRLLSYVNRRTQYEGRISSGQELTILSYHLKKNLWLDDKHDFVMLHDDISADLDVAMLARRDGLPGRKTPSGILTKLANTSVGRLIETVERSPQPATIALGFELLKLGEDAVEVISQAIDHTVNTARADGKHHDATVATGKGESGITIHCNNYPRDVAMSRLQAYCQKRKYRQKADSWFGVWLSPEDEAPRGGVSLISKWELNEELERLSRGMQAPSQNIREMLKKPRKPRKLGRNDPCPCGSGKKYKKCHLGRD